MNKYMKFIAALVFQIVLLIFFVAIFTGGFFDIKGEKIFFIILSVFWFTNALTLHAGEEVICEFIDNSKIIHTHKHRDNYPKIVKVFIGFGAFFMLFALFA